MAAQDMKDAFLSVCNAGRNLQLDASAVERIGTPGLQVLWSLSTTFEKSGLDLSIDRPSPAFLDALGDATLDLSQHFNSGIGLQ